MKTLHDYYSIIDKPDFDGKTDEDVIKLLPPYIPENPDSIFIVRECNAFKIRKSFNYKNDPKKGTANGLSWMCSGKITNEDGKKVDVYIPDVRALKQDDFEYYESRYNTCSSLYPKVQYGLLVYFGQATTFSKRNEFKSNLCEKLIELSEFYWNKSLTGGEGNYNFQHYFRYITLAFNILQKAKLTADLDILCKDIIYKYTHWDIHRKDSLRGILDLSGLMSQNYSLFKSEVDFNEIISKNLAVSYELKDTYTWEAIYIVDLCICIKNKQGVDAKNLVHYKAELFEKMANERTDALVCITFIEMALRLYKTAGDSNRVAKMEAAYMKIRGKIKLDTQIREMPLEYIDVVTKMIDEMIKTSDEETIIFDLMDTGWFLSTIQIKEQADLLKSKSIFSSIVPTIIKDKFGNTIDKYITDDEIREMFFWQEYGVSYQLGLQKLQQFIIEAYKAGKFSYDSVMHYLESTWYNIPIRHTYCEEVFDIKILDVLSPGLKLFFNELDESSKSSEYHFNYITITDTLVLKIETILRLYCEKIGIATMKPRVKSGESLVMEKLLDDLLSDLKSISEKPTPFNDEDWLLIKYALTLKGCNLRNRVAHGLMDAWEYNFSQIVIVLVIILRLSKYFK